MNLYDLTVEYQSLLEMAEEDCIDPQTLKDTFEALDGEIEDKADGYAKVIRSLESDSNALKAEIERLKDRKDAIDNNISSMKKRLEIAMVNTGKTKFKTQLFSFGIQKNAPSLNVVDEKRIPKEFWTEQEPKLNKKAALDYIKAHGDQEWGELQQTESLRIR